MLSGRRAKLGFAMVWGLLGGGALFAQSVIRQGGEFQVNRLTLNNQYDPSVAVDADGDFVVVWTDAIQDGGKGIWALLFNSAGTVLGGQFRVNTYTPNAQSRAVVASESNGDFVVAWMSNRQNGAALNFYTIYGQRFTSAGGPVGVEFQVNSSTAYYSRFPKIASDADGDFVVAWEVAAADPNSAVHARRFNSSGAAQGAEFRVNTYTANRQSNPAVASDADGDFVIAWESAQQDGNGYGIIVKRFNSAGTVLANEFQANSYTSNNQYVPAIAAEADGDFTVVWQSRHQEGASVDGLGVFGRRFTSSGVGQAIEFMVNTYTIQTQRQATDRGRRQRRFRGHLGEPRSRTVPSRASSPGASRGGGPLRSGVPGELLHRERPEADLHQLAATNGQAVDFDADGDFVIAWTTEYPGRQRRAPCSPSASRCRRWRSSTSTATAWSTRSPTVSSTCATASASPARRSPPERPP